MSGVNKFLIKEEGMTLPELISSAEVMESCGRKTIKDIKKIHKRRCAVMSATVFLFDLPGQEIKELNYNSVSNNCNREFFPYS